MAITPTEQQRCDRRDAAILVLFGELLVLGVAFVVAIWFSGCNGQPLGAAAWSLVLGPGLLIVLVQLAIVGIRLEQAPDSPGFTLRPLLPEGSAKQMLCAMRGHKLPSATRRT